VAKWKIYQNPVNGYTEKVKEGFNWVVFLFGPKNHYLQMGWNFVGYDDD
jgi:hypothetical protein